LKGGFIAWAQMGDPNASIPTPQPVYMRPMFPGLGRAVTGASLAFVSKASMEAGTIASYGLLKKPIEVRDCRALKKTNMKLNDAMPKITVDPETYRVEADGEHLTCEPAKRLALAQRYSLF